MTTTNTRFQSTVEDPERRKAVSTLQLLQQLVEEEGIGSLYHGIVPVLQSLCISNFVYFYTFHSLKALSGATSTTAIHSPLRDLVIGMVAGVINVLTTTPVWVVNTRLKTASKSIRQPYTNLLEGLWYIFKTEGIYGLWAGTIPSLILVSNPALQFMMYEALKRRFSQLPQHTSALRFFLMGAVAKAFATVVTYPLQLVQTKLRQGRKEREESTTSLTMSSEMVHMFVSIVKRYGALGLFRGLEAKLLQTVLTAALMFMAYEKIVRTVTSLLIRSKK